MLFSLPVAESALPDLQVAHGLLVLLRAQKAPRVRRAEHWHLVIVARPFLRATDLDDSDQGVQNRTVMKCLFVCSVAVGLRSNWTTTRKLPNLFYSVSLDNDTLLIFLRTNNFLTDGRTTLNHSLSCDVRSLALSSRPPFQRGVQSWPGFSLPVPGKRREQRTRALFSSKKGPRSGANRRRKGLSYYSLGRQLVKKVL